MDLAPVQNVGSASLQSYVTKKKPQQYRSGRDQQHSRLEKWSTPRKVRNKMKAELSEREEKPRSLLFLSGIIELEKQVSAREDRLPGGDATRVDAIFAPNRARV